MCVAIARVRQARVRAMLRTGSDRLGTRQGGGRDVAAQPRELAGQRFRGDGFVVAHHQAKAQLRHRA